MFSHQKVGQNCNMKAAYKSFENAEHLKYLETTSTNKLAFMKKARE